MRDHTKFRAFELADELALIIYQATKGFLRAGWPGSLLDC